MGDTIYYDENINDGKGMKSARQFMEECNVPCYNSTVKNHGNFSGELKKNMMPLPFSLYMMNIFFDNVESKEHLHQMKKKYTCDIPGSYLYVDPTDIDNKQMFRSSNVLLHDGGATIHSSDFHQARE